MGYDINSIETLQFKDAVRQRIPMYLGSNDMEGVYNGIQEIISNSIDEFIMGYGDRIDITLYPDNYISIMDYGRGVHFGIRDNGENVLEAIYSHAHTGGKFNDKDYQFAVGLNGIGAKATCLSSEKFSVVSVRDNKIASICFEKGNKVDYTEVENDNKENGTYIKYKPDSEVFSLEPIEIKFSHLCDTCQNLSFLTKGLSFRLTDETVSPAKTVVYKSDNGLVDLVKSKADKIINESPISYSVTDGKNSVEIAAVWTKGKEKSFCFTNGVLNAEGGTPMTGIKTAITNSIKKRIGNITGDLARTGLIYAVSCKVVNPSFANQTKTKINNPELRGLASKAFSEGFDLFSKSYPDEEKKIIDFLSKEEKAERAAERARNSILNATKEAMGAAKKKSMVAEKLADCKFHDERSSLYITEGDSAAGSVKLARNSDFVAVMPIRGKIINALKNPIDEVLDNEEVKAINKIMGCGLLGNVNISKLRYGKIFFAADSDPDGYSIICLLLTLFYRLWPELIEEGRVYWAQFPLYEVTVGNKVYFAYDDEELKKYPNGKISRNKGLGEMDPDSFERAAFSDEARAIQFSMEDAIEADNIINILLGKENEERTKYIFENIDFKEVEGE